jgi:hypothetical protein
MVVTEVALGIIVCRPKEWLNIIATGGGKAKKE